ncbi:MAG: alginate export family protein [Thermodesulfovibrionia bacterium]
MRRILIVFLSALLVVGLSASAFALHGKEAGFTYEPTIVKAGKAQINIGGELRFRGWYEDTDFDTDNDEERAWYDGRVKLQVDATISPNTTAVVEIETGGTKDDVYKWGADKHGGSGATGEYKEGNAKIGDLTIRQAYVAHQGKGLGTLAGFKVGHMPVKLGNGLFLNHGNRGDDGIVLWISPSKGTEISLTTLKFREGGEGEDDDDADSYTLAAETALNGVKVSGDVSYVYDQSLTGDVELWNIGIRGEAALAAVTLRGDIEIQTGEDNTGVDTVDYEGWALLLGADAKVGPAKATAEFGYGSGDDPDTSDNEAFITSLSSGQKYTWVYDYRVKTAAGATNTGLTNTWYVRLGASTEAAPGVKVGADFYYLNAVEDVSINGGTPDDNLGVELDANLEYQIDTNLVYFVTGGVLFVGDAYNYADREADNVYSIAHGITYKF